MCYSAQITSDYRKYQRHGGKLSLSDFAALWLRDPSHEKRKRPKAPKALEDMVAAMDPGIRELIDAWNAEEAAALEPELFKQRKRVADAERRLLTKVTKKAQDDVRIGTNKVVQIKGWLDDFKRKTLEPRDERIFPQWYAPVLVVEDGQRVIKPMRYQCRLAGMPASSDYAKDGKLSGTYNARRDNLERFWRRQFGYTHGLMVISTFYENVEGEEGQNKVLQFTPKDGSDMLVACLWSHWIDPAGKEPDLLSFAAITDEPEPEVAAAGHDRTIINIKPEHVDAWPKPDPANLETLYAIFDDKQHPYYEFQIEKAA
jgi:putative SOS response-associated peptidase YedK